MNGAGLKCHQIQPDQTKLDRFWIIAKTVGNKNGFFCSTEKVMKVEGEEDKPLNRKDFWQVLGPVKGVHQESCKLNSVDGQGFELKRKEQMEHPQQFPGNKKERKSIFKQ